MALAKQATHCVVRSFSKPLKGTRFLATCVQRLATVSSTYPPILHIPVMLEETLTSLNIRPGSTVIDMTFGAGGHSKEILSRFNDCHVIALDRDEEAYRLAQDLSEREKGRVTPILGKFSELDSLLKGRKIAKGSIDAMLLDAGCSSMQFDQGSRGFALSKDGPLDMRMDGNRYPDQITAADVVNHLDREELENIILKYGEEKKASEIARSLVENRPFTRTKQLAAAVGNAVSLFDHSTKKDAIGRRSHVATKTFMALRIFVNDEMNELLAALQCAKKYLRDGGRLVVLTFHSLEERLVRTFLRRCFESSKDTTTLLASKSHSPKMKSFMTEKDLMSCTPEDEIALNPRSRSALLRVATRCRAK